MIMQKFDVISKLKHSEKEISELEKYNDELKLLNEKSEMEIEELIRENLKLNEEIKKLINEDEFKNLMKQKLEDFYDIIIDINSIKNINKEGWKVKFNERGIESYIDSKSNELVTIGVLGNVKKGKSFLLSRILKVKLLDEKHTKGLCVKFPEFKGFLGRHIIMLDSEGFETPVFKNINKKEEKNYNKIELLEESKENKINKEMLDNKEFKDNLTDKIATELYLQNFIIMESDILLIVVGELIYSEQLLINKIKEESKKQNKKRIYIIHNLKEFITVNQVENYIKNIILKICKSNEKENNELVNEIYDINKENEHDESNLNEKSFIEIINYDKYRTLEVYDLIIANEDSEVGKIYNESTYKFIEQEYNLMSEPKKFDIFEQIKKNFKRLSDIILREDIKYAQFYENEKIIKDKLIKLEYDKDLIFKKIYKDELGFVLFKSDVFEPKYNYFKPDENTLEIRLEIPGNSNCEVYHRIINDETIITVKGKKRLESKPKKLEDNLFNIREFGNFEKNIPLSLKDFKINNKPKEGYPKFLNGVICIQYKLLPKGREIEEDINDIEL